MTKQKIMRVNVMDSSGRVRTEACNVKDLKMGTRRHSSLSPEWQARADSLWPRVGRYMVKSQQEWTEGFLCDQNPDQEIVIWEAIAEVVDYFFVDDRLKALDRKTLTSLVCNCCNGLVDVSGHFSAGGVTDEIVASIRLRLEDERGAIRWADNTIEVSGPIPIGNIYQEGVAADNNPLGDFRPMLEGAQVIFGVDSVTGEEFVVYGLDRIKEIISSGRPQNFRSLYVLVDMSEECDDLETLTALVEAVRGRHDYNK